MRSIIGRASNDVISICSTGVDSSKAFLLVCDLAVLPVEDFKLLVLAFCERFLDGAMGLSPILVKVGKQPWVATAPQYKKKRLYIYRADFTATGEDSELSFGATAASFFNAGDRWRNTRSKINGGASGQTVAAKDA